MSRVINIVTPSFGDKLLGENRVIVSDIAGTTRDAIDSNFENEFGKYVFIDTAGIRKTTDKVEQIGVDKSKNLIDRADLILFLLDNNTL